MRKDLDWFKKEIAGSLNGYAVEYKFWESGDFGSLNQVEFNSDKIGGEVDFWGWGWLGIHLVDYETGNVLLNVLLEPNEFEQQDLALRRLQELVAQQ